jgi:hypothetical protein
MIENVKYFFEIDTKKEYLIGKKNKCLQHYFLKNTT